MTCNVPATQAQHIPAQQRRKHGLPVLRDPTRAALAFFCVVASTAVAERVGKRDASGFVPPGHATMPTLAAEDDATDGGGAADLGRAVVDLHHLQRVRLPPHLPLRRDAQGAPGSPWLHLTNLASRARQGFAVLTPSSAVWRFTAQDETFNIHRTPASLLCRHSHVLCLSMCCKTPSYSTQIKDGKHPPWLSG